MTRPASDKLENMGSHWTRMKLLGKDVDLNS